MTLQYPKFTREQLRFFAEVILISAVDRIESGMPTSGIAWADRLQYVNGIDTDAKSLTAWDRCALETTGMSLAVLYAQLTGDGLGIYDALACAGRFDKAVTDWVELTWKDQGVVVTERIKSLGNGGWQIEQAYTNFPDCRKHAVEFVDSVFDWYLS